MLVKLLKYDLKYMIRNMSIFYILALFFAITTRIIFGLDKSVIVSIIGNISVGCMFSMIASILFNTMIRCCIRFRDSLFKDESYLTHTLPVTKNEIYNSKLLQTLIFFFIGFIIVVLSLFIVYYSKDNWIAITNYVKNITIGLNMSTFFFVTMFLLVVFLELYNAIQCGYYGIILGHKKNNGKIGYSILFGFILYLVSQTIVLALVFVYGLFDSSIMSLFKTATVSIDANAFKILLVVASLLYIVIIYIMSLLSKKSLNKGVDVE